MGTVKHSLCWHCFRASSDRRGCPRVQSIGQAEEEHLIPGSKWTVEMKNYRDKHNKVFTSPYHCILQCPKFVRDNDFKKIEQILTHELKFEEEEIKSVLKHQKRRRYSNYG